MLLSTRSAPDSATSRIRPFGAGEHFAAASTLGGARGRVLVGERDPRHAVLDRLLDERDVVAPGGEADDLERLRRALDDVERLGADGPR